MPNFIPTPPSHGALGWDSYVVTANQALDDAVTTTNGAVQTIADGLSNLSVQLSGTNSNVQTNSDKLRTLATQFVDLSTYAGYDPTGSTDSTAAFQQAISDALVSKTVSKILLVSGSPKVTSTLRVDADRGLTIRGTGYERATLISYTGTGALFQNGTDTHVGNHGAAFYDGNQGFVVENLRLDVPNGSRDTALSNGLSNYKAGTTGIVDWYGGGIQLRNVQISGFETGFAGYQSDVNRFDNVTLLGLKTGLDLQDRTDQLTATALYILLCDRAVNIQGAIGARFYGCQFVGNGSASVNSIRIANSAAGRPSYGISFDDCWFEFYQGFAGGDVEAFVEVGVGDTVADNVEIHFRNPLILTNPSGGFHTKYFVKVEKANGISVENPHGSVNSLDKLYLAVGSTSPALNLRARKQAFAQYGVQNNGTGSPSFTPEFWGSAGVDHGTSALTAGAVSATSVASTGAVSGASVAATAGVTGATGTFTTSATVGQASATTATLNLNGATAQAKNLVFQTGNQNRWIVRQNSTTESGSNAGSDLEISNRDDTGASLSVCFGIMRNNGLIRAFGGIQNRTKAGAPTDADWAVAPTDGTTVVDTTNSRLYVRVGGTWKSTLLA